MSYCQNKTTSCAACCGIYNLSFRKEELLHWIKQNTESFLQTDISKKENIVRFRELGEKKIQNQKISQEIYVCPFVGFVAKGKIGCLLHPTGSPHPQISLYAHPQNFSFYGEAICQGYNCFSKEKEAYGKEASFLQNMETYVYGQLAGNYRLAQCFQEIAEQENISLSFVIELFILFMQKVKKTLHYSSFELSLSKQEKQNPYFIVGAMLDKFQKPEERVEITEEAKKIGMQFRKEVAIAKASQKKVI
ncbi:MAG: hypothetical protein D6767_08535 [Candidatus Hydrogenedentota bacterium]|nr:MAG: hypothetical protein D6767_08535 [Candidatus Hydrogenedentota bacterium]